MRTMIAVPCMDMLHTAFADSLVRLLSGREGYEVRFGASSLIYDTRNSLLGQAIDGGFDRVIWFDSDMTFGPEVWDYLMEDLDHGFGIVSGLYFKRRNPFTPVILKTCDIANRDDGKIEPISEVYLDYPEDSLFDIAACGFGCVAMDVQTAKAITDRFGRYLFMPINGFGEDLSFCLRARAAGQRIFCDSRAKLGHVGQAVYNEDTYKSLHT